MKFRYKKTKEEYKLSNGDVVIMGTPYIGDMLTCVVREDLEVCDE